MNCDQTHKNMIRQYGLLVIFMMIVIVGIIFAFSLQIQIQKQDFILRNNQFQMSRQKQLDDKIIFQQRIQKQIVVVNQKNGEQQIKLREGLQQTTKIYQNQNIGEGTNKQYDDKGSSHKTSLNLPQISKQVNQQKFNNLQKQQKFLPQSNVQQIQKQQNIVIPQIDIRPYSLQRVSLNSFNAVPPQQNHLSQNHAQKSRIQKLVIATKNPKPSVIQHGITQQQLIFSRELINLKNQPLTSDLAKQEKYYYEQKYNLSKYQELPFCVVVPSYQNQASNRYLQNINSILQQDYSNFKVIFIDDASEDNTWQLINKFKRDHRVSDQKLKLVRNQNRLMAMGSIHKAAYQYCEPYQIFMIVDGDDELVGKQVFNHFNSLFQGQDLWLAYSNFISGTTNAIGYSRPYSEGVISTNSFRKSGFTISHLRAFYTKLFRLIKKQDLRDDNGNLFRAANDFAIMIPILQMVQNKHHYSPQISYLYNPNTGLNNHATKLQQQTQNAQRIRVKPPYTFVKTLFNEEQIQKLKKHTGQKIPLIDLSLPEPINYIPKFGWEL